MLRVVMMSLLVLTASHSAWAVFAMPSPAPVDRLIQNTQAYIDEHPDDATGYYTLGRIHYLAFSKSTDAAAGMLNNEGLPAPSVMPVMLVRSNWCERGWRWRIRHRCLRSSAALIGKPSDRK